MKARGGRFLLILGAGLAALAFIVVYVVMSRGSAQPDPSAAAVTKVDMVKVAVAKQSLPAFTVLDSTNVQLKEVEALTVPSGAATSIDSVAQMMTLEPLDAGQTVLKTQLTKAGFSNVLLKGEHAIALPVNERNAFGGGITENDRVDLLWSHVYNVTKPERSGEGAIIYKEGTFNTTKTLLQDIRVLRVISLKAPTAPAPEGQTDEKAASARQAALAGLFAEDAPPSTVLILGVNDQQAEVIKYARENGRIDLTLRSSAVTKDAANNEVRGDHEIQTTTGITIDALVKEYGLVPPPANWVAPATP